MLIKSKYLKFIMDGKSGHKKSVSEITTPQSTARLDAIRIFTGLTISALPLKKSTHTKVSISPKRRPQILPSGDAKMN